MKKLVLSMVALLAIGCANPSMERGLESLNASLAELDAAVVALNIEQMQADLQSMQDMAADMIVTAEENRIAMDEALNSVDGILAGLARVKENLDQAATAEQVAELAAAVEEFGEGIDMLVFLADYDYDGVMNGLDQCPDTPLSEINDVNGVGCSSSQTPTTGTTTSTIGG